MIRRPQNKNFSQLQETKATLYFSLQIALKV